MSHTIFDDGHIASPNGYRATGISCGLKDGSKARDVALVYSLHPANVAALFTTSLTKAAPVFLSQAILSRNREAMRAVMINSGQANAGTGQAGLTDAVECAKLVADELEIPRDGVLVMSTGVIGVPLPMQKMREGIKRAVSELDSGGGRRAAVAMLTTDSRPKERVLRLQLREGQRCTLAGMAKGSRMIHPRLATMLCVITTDAAIEQRLLQRALQNSVAHSFNRMNVDGEVSPNDGVIMLANGAADARPINDPDSREFTAFQSALDVLCADLAQQIVRDAAGSGKIMHVYVRGAADEMMALAVADKISQSRSLRSALRRGMPEWGSIMAAVGATPIELRPELLDIRLGSVRVLHEGEGTPFDMTAALQAVSGPEVEITVDLNLGPVEVHVLSCTWFED
ncbi:MAG: bifunctional glutamate N-acetyltransferase/amino-acid acetyltransferase ArgJ [Candidatus Viridilinea halotolerans]|uniref:Arginine biosynthesis bifunctional protein ArgJ n=1 Tax=Candidatus Viridilinea halotolerans TaxID=2491704 RepID=A0A426U4P3_9CHLR|nr:MAG: bifunctional glutamate N-acetyltransferase/amino-acid acetyltransferase ArgJ [Candidatus Viridilinea halotolerans]